MRNHHREDRRSRADTVNGGALTSGQSRASWNRERLRSNVAVAETVARILAIPARCTSRSSERGVHADLRSTFGENGIALGERSSSNGLNFTDQAYPVYTLPFPQVQIMYAIVQAGGRQIKVVAGNRRHRRRNGWRTGRRADARPGAARRERRRRSADRRAVCRQRPNPGGRRRRDARTENPRVQEEAPQGHAPDQRPSRVLHARSRQGHSSVGFRSWLIKKVKAARETVAIPTPSGSASRRTTGTWSRAARSSSASEAAGFVRD